MTPLTFILIIVMAAGGGIAFLIWFLTRYKHRMIVHEITGSKTIDRIAKFRIGKNRNGISWWVPINKRYGKKIKPAPSEACMVTAKGKMSASAVWSREKKFQWLIPEHLPDAKYRILTDAQKNAYLEEMRDTQQWQKKHWTTVLGQMAPMLAIIIIIAIMVFGWADLMAPAIEMGHANAETAKQLSADKVRIAEIDKGIQRIEARLNSVEPVTPEAPPD